MTIFNLLCEGGAHIHICQRWTFKRENRGEREKVHVKQMRHDDFLPIKFNTSSAASKANQRGKKVKEQQQDEKMCKSSFSCICLDITSSQLTARRRYQTPSSPASSSTLLLTRFFSFSNLFRFVDWTWLTLNRFCLPRDKTTFVSFSLSLPSDRSML